MKRLCIILIILIMIDGSVDIAKHRTPNALIAEQLLIQKNYKVLAYKGSVHCLIL
jgi:hypothetical protein